MIASYDNLKTLKDSHNTSIVYAWYQKVIDNVNFYGKKYFGKDFPVATLPTLSNEEITDIYDDLSHNFDVYPNEIESAILLLRVKNKRLVNAILAVQGGKTSAAILYVALRCVYDFLKYDKICEYLYVVPGIKSIQEMTENTFKHIKNLFGKIEFVWENKSTSFGHLLLNRMNNADKHTMFCSRIYAMTSAQDTREQILKAIHDSRKRHKNFIIIWDEAHYADSKNSNPDKLIGAEIRKISKSVTKNSQNQVVFLSATPWPYLNALHVTLIRLKLGKNYTGFNFIDGKDIDPDVPIVTPDIISYSDMQKALGLKEIPLIPKAAFADNTFNRINKNGELSLHQIRNKRQYFDELCEQIAAFIKYYQIDLNKKGCLFRILNHNKKTDKIIAKLKSLCKCEFLRYYENDIKDLTKLNERTRECRRDNVFFVIIVSNQARMSNRFGSEVEVFADFTYDYSTCTAAIQSIPGRAAGYHGRRIVIVSPKNYIYLREFVNTKGLPGYKRPHLRAHIPGSNGKWVQTYNFFADDLNASFLFDWFEECLDSAIADQCKKIKEKGKRPNGKWNGNPRGKFVCFQILNEGILEKLDTTYGIKLLRIGEVPEYFEKQQFEYHTKNDEIFIAFRSAENDADGGLMRTRKFKNVSMTQSLHKNRGIEPHIHINIEEEKIELIQLQLAKRHFLRTENQSGKCVVLPSKESLHYDFIGDDEKEGI